MSGGSSSRLFTKIARAVRHRTCPICLGQIECRRAAVLSTCMHAYCLGCVRKWSYLRRNCPLCKAEFDRWFCQIKISTGEFEEEHLDVLKVENVLKLEAETGYQGAPGDYRRFLSRSRAELCRVIRHSRSLPRRRSFGRSRIVPQPSGSRDRDELIAERILQWRVSRYKRAMYAVPLHLPSRVHGQKNIRDNNVKSEVQQRIEPWIQRELQAILDDSEPSLVVQLASSLWILSLEDRHKPQSDNALGVDKIFQQLRPFLYDRTDQFWHELRCFAESSLTIEAYDSVVEYKHHG
ncbi:hypothetical protein H6P81_015051 [Aristolochia fimbriata]|uniref:RING-type E3 ubiquitin transferase n=1 Tax=Aristolochia fimbriata TaxID=158543 RepID=A0AAV7E7A8_ARIFI|nr:hypothetical protein H6P81_015051 [Aristolochia fimbriata]